MARKGAVRRAGTAIARTAKKLTSKLHPGKRTKAEPVKARATTRATPKVKTARATPRPAARPTKRTTDIPLDVVARTYTPNQTSLKTPFRADGSDRQRDQDLPGEGWNDEDHYTNKSGDPRIGTHGRAYEPGEKN
jgi:hypothetical protein